MRTALHAICVVLLPAWVSAQPLLQPVSRQPGDLRREVRAYNVRSGRQELATTAPKNAVIRLYDHGFQIGPTFYAPKLALANGPRVHYSPDPFSIAEFSVRRPRAALSRAALAGARVAVLAFQGSVADATRDMLGAALTTKLQAAGFSLVERRHLKAILEELKFENAGPTDSRDAARLGRLANARFAVVGDVQTTGAVVSLTLQLVAVETATVENAVELECRDCGPDDYLQALTFLVQDWTAEDL